MFCGTRARHLVAEKAANPSQYRANAACTREELPPAVAAEARPAILCAVSIADSVSRRVLGRQPRASDGSRCAGVEISAEWNGKRTRTMQLLAQVTASATWARSA